MRKQPRDHSDYTFDSYITEMLSDKNRHIQIIAKYLITRGLQYDTYDKMQVVIRRHLRPARQLIAFSDEELKYASETCQRKYFNIDWTLDTMLKVLTSTQSTNNKQNLRF